MLPLSLAPELLRNIAKFNPFTYAVDASRALVAGDFGADSVVKAFIIIGVLAILTIYWATRSIRQAAM
jgi:ABC-2 type transport system permease protein